MRILLGMPCMRSIPFKTVVSLLNTVKKGVVDCAMVEGSLVYDSRNTIAQAAIDGGYDYVLYVDSDMVFNSQDVENLVRRDTDIVTGLYVTRNGENLNVCYSSVTTRGWRRPPKMIHDNLDSGYAEIAACGFGFCLIKTEVIKCMSKRYKSLFEPKWGLGEDIAFCVRAKRCGYKIMVDRDVKLGHIGEMVYE